MRSARTINDSQVCVLLARVYSAFYPVLVQGGGGRGEGGGGEDSFRETNLGLSPRVCKELGPTRGLPAADCGLTHIHAMHVWHFSHEAGVKFVSLNSAFHPSVVGT